MSDPIRFPLSGVPTSEAVESATQSLTHDLLYTSTIGTPDHVLTVLHAVVGNDLAQRCAEIAQWRNSGIYSGTALQALAERLVRYDESETLRYAEEQTIKEAVQLLAVFAPLTEAILSRVSSKFSNIADAH